LQVDLTRACPEIDRDVRAFSANEAVPTKVNVAAYSSGVPQIFLITAGENTAADLSVDGHELGPGEQVAGDDRLIRDDHILAESSHVTIDGAVDGHRLPGSDQHAIDRAIHLDVSPPMMRSSSTVSPAGSVPLSLMLAACTGETTTKGGTEHHKKSNKCDSQFAEFHRFSLLLMITY